MLTVQSKRQNLPKLIMTLGIILALSVGLMGLFYLKQTASAIVPPTTLGMLGYQKYETHRLTDKASLQVNVANGNVILVTNEMNIKGTGLDLGITRYLNNRANENGQMGHNWTTGVGADVSLTVLSSGDIEYQGPSGYEVTFTQNGSGGFNTPSTFTGAKLEAVSTGGWKMTFNKSGETYTFNSAGKQTEHANRNGQKITYAYNTNGTLATATDTQGRVMTFDNYTGNYVGKITDNTGRFTTYTYDSGNILTRSTDAEGNVWEYQYYDTRGNLNQIVDPRGYTTTLTYDSDNRVTQIKLNDYTTGTRTWNYSYNNTSSQTVSTNPRGKSTTYTYDSLGRITTTLNPVGSTNSATWDANNNQTSSTDPSGQVTTMVYDTLNNLTSTTKPAPTSGTGAKDTYDYSGTAQPYQPQSSTDSSGNITSYSYNAYGNMISQEGGTGTTGAGMRTYLLEGDLDSSNTLITCGAKDGQLCESVDPNGNSTTYTYDSVGNLLTVVAPGPVGTKTYTYDSLSRPATVTDGNGSMVTYTYDDMDRVVKAVYAQDSSVIDYIYDKHGNLVQRNDSSGQTLWTYSGHNQVTQLRQTSKADLNYTYDGAGNLSTEQGPAGTITYTYDDANQINNINQSNSNQNQAFTFTDGRITSRTVPGGITETIGYDNAGRQTSIKATKGSTVLTDYSASYTNSTGNDVDLKVSARDNLAGIDYNYTYDSLLRLTAQTSSTGTEDYTYQYDLNGNLTQKSENGVYGPILAYNAANQLITSGGAPSGTYDSAGNQTSTGTGTALSYNAKNQTGSITPSGSSTRSATYSDGSQTERLSFGSETYQNGLLGLYSTTAASTATYFTRIPSGSNQALGQSTGSSNYYYLTDLRGSVVKMTDASGNVITSYNYDPYGRTISSSGSVASNYRYVGGYYDNATNYYKFGARYYDPTQTRWTQLDPSGQNTSYLYSGNDPINNIDPSGYAFFNYDAAIENADEYSELGQYVGMGAGCIAGAASAAPSLLLVGVGCLAGTELGGALGYVAGFGVGFVYGSFQ